MNKILVVILASIIIGCSSNIGVQKIDYSCLKLETPLDSAQIEFARFIILNLDSTMIEVRRSMYYCGNKNLNAVKVIKSSFDKTFRFYNHQRILAANTYINPSTLEQTIISHDTLYRVVFKSIKNDGFITIQYQLINNRWCFSYIDDSNGLDFNVD